MNNTALQIYALFILLILSVGCKDDWKNLNLRSGENEPFYWENNKLAAQRLAKIMYNKTDSGSYERFKIVHISDSHLSSWSPSNNYELPINLRQSIQFANQQELRINAITATGDFISIDKKKKAKEYMHSFIHYLYDENHVPTFICTGNHDSNSEEEIGSTFFYKNEINEILFANSNYSKNRNSAENYYYSDVANPQGGTIRFIALDMLDQPASQYNTLSYAYFSQKQIDWLINTALKNGMTDHHSVIILTHYPFQRRSVNNDTYLCDGDYVHSWNMIPEIIEAFRTRSLLEKVYPNQFNLDPINVKADFSDRKGEFVCYLGGHIHCNAYFDVTGLENESTELVPQKMILCTNQAPSEKGVVYNRVIREEDSLSSNSFCIYAVDTKEKKIYITYFGAYKPSNDCNYPDIHTISYN